jgi:hypothetical protein
MSREQLAGRKERETTYLFIVQGFKRHIILNKENSDGQRYHFFGFGDTCGG